MFRDIFNKTWWINTVTFFLVATALMIPLSPTLKSIFLVGSLCGVLLTPMYRQSFSLVLSMPWCKVLIVLFFFLCVACFWSPAPLHTKFIFVEKYSKLLMLPVLALGFQKKALRQASIHAFLFAMFITCILSIFHITRSVDQGQVFHNHIVTSFMMSFAAYLAGLFSLQTKGIKRLLYITLIALFSYQIIFINAGRAGYLLYFMLMLLLLSQNIPAKHLVGSVVCFCLVFGFLSFQSSVFSNRLHQVIADLNHYQQGNINTPIGLRLMFHQRAKSIFLSSPLIGQGTGSFSYYFQKENTLPEWKNLLDPHSQYWLIAAEWGIIGLLLVFLFFVSLARSAFQLSTMKPIMLGMLVAFVLGNLTDSLLLYSAIGNLFILFSAMCLGELIESEHFKPLESTSILNRETPLCQQTA